MSEETQTELNKPKLGEDCDHKDADGHEYQQIYIPCPKCGRRKVWGGGWSALPEKEIDYSSK